MRQARAGWCVRSATLIAPFRNCQFLWHLSLKPVRGKDHTARLNSFYAGQGHFYDESRKMLLAARSRLFSDLAKSPNSIWLDMGGGTGAAFAEVREDIRALKEVYIVDVTDSLLDVARRRIEENGWPNVIVARGDMTNFIHPEEMADIITFSFSLTMEPRWHMAIRHAFDLLRPGGIIGVVDFYLAEGRPAKGIRAQSIWMNHLWPALLRTRHVDPSPDHLPYLMRNFETLSMHEESAPVPFMLGLQAPVYRFIGRKSAQQLA